MLHLKRFTFNPFQENTYLLYTDTKNALIVDPGMYDRSEQKELLDFLDENELKLVKLLNTHTHIDHVFGNKFIFDKYGLKPYLHKEELKILDGAKRSAEIYGLDYDPSDEIEGFLEEGDVIDLDGHKLKCLFVPGHSPGHLVFINEAENYAIGGDVLFRGSIGRTDLPFGDHDTLINMIKEKMFELPLDMKVHPGHGDYTTVGFEKANNPFF